MIYFVNTRQQMKYMKILREKGCANVFGLPKSIPKNLFSYLLTTILNNEVKLFKKIAAGRTPVRHYSEKLFDC